MDFNLNKKTISSYGGNYSPDNLLKKITKVAKNAGVKVVYGVLLLYYALIDGRVPLKDKAIVIGALGYFILPFDFIPDILGMMGYGDDLTVLVYALKTIWNNINDEVHAQARKKLGEWFEDVSKEDLRLF